MKTIVPGREAVAKVWGSPKPKDTEYRLIHYHISADCEDGVLLHHVVTGEMVLLSPEEASWLTRLPLPFTEGMEDLISHRFLVPAAFDEHKSVLQLRAVLQKTQKKKGITSYTILPTTACNARCFYCYESDYPKHTMTAETAHKLVEYMDEHRGDAKRLGLSWFGGEPTLCVPRIDQICSELQERGIEYTSSMISNGYLFTEELAKHAKDFWKLTNIQITLDGTEEIYNKVKSYVGVKDNPYYRVLDNIQHLLGNEIRVSVRMNLDRHNEDNLRLLVDELAERFLGNAYFHLYSHVLFDDEGCEPVRHTEEDSRELEDCRIGIDTYISEKGFPKAEQNGLPSLKTNWCMADSPYSLMVNPLGEFGKCQHYMYEYMVGDVSSAIDTEALSRWRETEEKEECSSCFLFPNCMILHQCPDERKCFSRSLQYVAESHRKQIGLVYSREKVKGGDADGDETV